MAEIHEKTASAGASQSPPLLRALSASTQIKRRVEACVAELSSLNAVLRQEIAESLPLRYVVQALTQSKCVEDKVQQCALDLHAMNAALAEEISERMRLERALFETRAELSMTQAEEEKIRHLAFHDTLTGLPNRALFDDRLAHAMAHAARCNSPLAVLFIDLDRFKQINDLYGHGVGDKLLQTVALRLRRSVRAEDTVSRHGGDEFRCLLPGVRDAATLANIAQKLMYAVAAPFEWNGLKLTVRSSIGISQYHVDAHHADDLTKNADSAMYCAKQKGTGYCVFSECAAVRSASGITRASHAGQSDGSEILS